MPAKKNTFFSLAQGGWFLGVDSLELSVCSYQLTVVQLLLLMADGLWLVPYEAGVSSFSWDCHWPSAIVGKFPREWRKVINSNSGGLRNLPDVSSTSRRFVTGTSILVGRFPAGMECRYWVLKAAASGILRLAKSSSRRFINYTSLHSPLGESRYSSLRFLPTR